MKRLLLIVFCGFNFIFITASAQATRLEFLGSGIDPWGYYTQSVFAFIEFDKPFPITSPVSILTSDVSDSGFFVSTINQNNSVEFEISHNGLSSVAGTLFPGGVFDITTCSWSETPPTEIALIESTNWTATDWFGNRAVGTGNWRVAPIPEPATTFLFGFGLLGLAGVARSKNKRTKMIAPDYT